METINDIIVEMRKAMPRVVDAKVILRNYADRIEAAVVRENRTSQDSLQVQSVTDCNDFGNAAKMREALETISKCDIYKEEDCYTLYGVCESALSAPARNCDLYKSEPEAYQAYLTAMKNATEKTYVYFEPWLFAEAKGEVK